jgi:type II secretory pathway pseudopilin PulG
MRTGFTLVESLVALVLLEFALLAVVATSAVAARELAEARRLERAHAAARTRVEVLAGTSCPSVVSMTVDSAAGMVEHWWVQAVGSQRLIVDSVVVALPRGRVARTVARAGVTCGA